MNRSRDSRFSTGEGTAGTGGGQVLEGVNQPAPRYPEEYALVQDCVAGDRERWGELLALHERTLYFAIVNTLRAWDETSHTDHVADIQGDLVVMLSRERFRKLRLYSGKCRLAQWLKVVASNHTIDHVRRHARERGTVSLSGDDRAGVVLRQTLEAGDGTSWPDHHVQHQQMLKILRGLCSELPAEDQRFIKLFFHEERSFQEVSAVMNTTLDASYTRKNRIRNRLLKLARARGFLPAGV